MPIFTIIIPVYNLESYIEKCLSSIRCQTFKDFEVIIIDDGSTDGSAIISKRLVSADNRFSYFYQENCGQGLARNVGLDKASGEYILFIDGDDWVDKYLLEKTLKVFNQYPVDFVNYRFDFFFESGTLKKISGLYTKKELFDKDIFYAALVDRDIFSVVWNKVYRRSLIEKNNIRFPDVRAIEDLYFVRVIASMSSHTVFINDILKFFYLIFSKKVLYYIKN